MTPDGSSFTALNLPPTFTLPRCMEYFTLKAAPNTKLWRKPPTGDIATAPIAFTSLRHPFIVAEVTITADWELEWDQGGLVIFTGAMPQSSSSSPSDHNRQRTGIRNLPTCKWVKAGMEFSSGTVHASSVSATADGADWCLAPLLPERSTASSTALHSLRIKLERIGHSLCIWYGVPSDVSPFARTPGAAGNTWKKLREVGWFFYGVEDKFVHVGVYASRPNSGIWYGSGFNRESEGLVVEFEDLEIF